MNLLRIAILGCSALLFAIPPSPDGREFSTSFCPDCWKFLNAEGSMSGEACAACGKLAVAVDAVTLAWNWCLSHDTWHREPCPEAQFGGSGHVRTALALVVAAGDERFLKAAYCPECGILPDPLKAERGRCPTCRGPLAVVDTANPTWFWCTHAGYWKTDPCPDNFARHCCLVRTGTLLAKIRFTGKSPGSESGLAPSARSEKLR